MTADESPWLESLVAELRDTAGSPEKLREIFSRLQAEHGAEEAGHRWWAANGALDASST